MTRSEKFNLLYNQENFLLPGAYIIIMVKIISLSLYTYFTFKFYKKESVNLKLWQRNILAIAILYTIAYILYSARITGISNSSSSLFLHLPIIMMVILVFYVSYVTYAKPEIINGNIKLLDPNTIFKYKKSGLTTQYSIELKECLLTLEYTHINVVKIVVLTASH